MEYERFERRLSHSKLQVQLPPPLPGDGVVRLWISRDFLDRVAVDRIEPEPKSSILASDRNIYEFAIAPRPNASAHYHHSSREMSRAGATIMGNPITNAGAERGELAACLHE